MGVDLDAVAAHIHALVDAHEAGAAREEPLAPTVRDPEVWKESRPEETARAAPPFLSRKANGKLALAAGMLAACAAGAAAVVIDRAPPEHRGVGQESASAVRVREASPERPPPDAGAEHHPATAPH